jgi:DNA-nicking Smr family endonuclease
MKKRPPVVDEEDAALFRDAVGIVRRIEAPPPAPAPRQPGPRARRFESDEAEALRESQRLRGGEPPPEGEEIVAWRRPEVSERTLKRLRRGEYSVQDELDLHTLRATDAEGALRRFLLEARGADLHCLRIIHGKGLRSEGAPVLKQIVDRMLRQRGDVLAFASAPPNQGGAGAVLVLLA